jgi:hypothetical protein
MRRGTSANGALDMKIKICYLTSLGLVISSVFFSGCYDTPRTYGTMFHAGISPIYPAMNYRFDNRYQTIDTLTPELKWKNLKKTNQTYDVCIWETPYRSIDDIKKKKAQFQSSWGIPVYSTNNIATNYFQILLRLKPDTFYNWSVRIRDGEKVGDWSSFEQQRAELSVIETRSGFPFGFKTPSQ